MSQSPYNQIIAAGSFTAGTAFAVDVPLYYERVIVTNESAGSDLYVSTNGEAVSNAEGDYGSVVLPGAWRMVPNDQPRQPLVSTWSPGSTVQNTGYQGASYPNLNGTEGGANHTLVSLMFPTGSTPGSVALEFV